MPARTRSSVPTISPRSTGSSTARSARPGRSRWTSGRGRRPGRSDRNSAGCPSLTPNHRKGSPMTVDTVDTTRLWDLIKDIKFAMFTARHDDGQLHSRPMTTQNNPSERGGVLWFFMSRSGRPVADLEEHPEVNVTYAAPCKDSCMSISCAARVVEDLERKQAMWNTFAQAWFPAGPSHPHPPLLPSLTPHADYPAAKPTT